MNKKAKYVIGKKKKARINKYGGGTLLTSILIVLYLFMKCVQKKNYSKKKEQKEYCSPCNIY